MSPDTTVTTEAPAEALDSAPPAGMHGPRGPLFRIIRDQRVAFLVVGAFNTVLGTAWFIVFELLLGPRLGAYGYMASLVCAHVAAVLCAFVLYRRFVFRVRGQVWLDLARFEVVNLSSLGINLLALPLCVEVLGLPPILAQLLITFVTALVSYFGHKGFSFRRGSSAASAPPRLRPEEGSTP
ncbi:GtrA family protein [Oerskovia sp. NPDC060338]|uniref:GtrA family protein n=1 Tax=unclassified Oerskovia TaxID=2619021 RepID=UPI001F1AC0EE|nr:GtrA family protein [Oerskovia sp. Root918]